MPKDKLCLLLPRFGHGDLDAVANFNDDPDLVHFLKATWFLIIPQLES